MTRIILHISKTKHLSYCTFAALDLWKQDEGYVRLGDENNIFTYKKYQP